MSTSYLISGGDFEGAGAATRSLKSELARIGVEAGVMRRVMIAAYEAEMNVVIHANGGRMWARLDGERLELEIVDEGPGIPNVDAAMREGFSTAPERARQMGFGAGMGLPNIRKCSDLFEIDSRVGRGTRVHSTIYLRAGAAAEPGASSLGLAAEKCRSCLTCVKACPTGALRVRRGVPMLLAHLCIDCTACTSACPSAVYGVREDAARTLEAPAGSILVVPRGFLSGFSAGVSPASVAAALAFLGFSLIRHTEEWEAPLAAEAVRAAGERTSPWPLIIPSCPAVVTLVETHFPSLIGNILPFVSPAEAAVEEYPVQPVTFVAACPAQHSAVTQARATDRLTVISARRLAAAVAPLLSAGSGQAARREAGLTGARPLGAQLPGAHAAGVERVTGIRHVMAVLEQVEAGALCGVPVIEPFACDQGCIGSPLFAADPFVAECRWTSASVGADTVAGARGEASARPRRRPLVPRAGLRLDPDMAAAVAKLARIDALTRALPGRDCAACGAPGCGAFAEDVVLGRAVEGDCPHFRAAERSLV